MKGSVSGKPSCSRISHDSTRATRPIASAVHEYWIAITFASWQNTYFVHQLLAWYSSTSRTSAAGTWAGGLLSIGPTVHCDIRLPSLFRLPGAGRDGRTPGSPPPGSTRPLPPSTLASHVQVQTRPRPATVPQK